MHTIVNSRNNLAIIVFLGMCSVIASVLAFEHLGGYIPCALCLKQRIPYYYAIPVGLIAAIMAKMGYSTIVRIALIIVAGLIFWSLVLASYHSGVEWGYWPGPSECAAPTSGIGATTSVDNLLGQLSSSKPPSCNEAAGRFLWLSFAGWNVVVSAGLIILAIRAAWLPAKI